MAKHISSPNEKLDSRKQTQGVEIEIEIKSHISFTSIVPEYFRYFGIFSPNLTHCIMASNGTHKHFVILQQVYIEKQLTIMLCGLGKSNWKFDNFSHDQFVAVIS